MKVELIEYTHDGINRIAWLARATRNHELDISDKDNNNNEKFVKSLLKVKHLGILEHITFTFHISEISRVCYDDKTEVYTSNGWKLFKDLNNEDKPLTLREDRTTEFQNYTNPTCYDYNGSMHRYLSQNIDLLVTPNHSMYIKKYDVRVPDKYHFIPSKDINLKRVYMTKNFIYNPVIDNTFQINGYEYDRLGNNGKTYKKHTGDIILDRKWFYKLLAWYISEGSCYYNEKENSASINIAQNKDKTDIIECISKCSFTPTSTKHKVTFKSLTMWNFLKQIGYSHEKYIPFDLFENFNQELADIFLMEYIKGDGSIDKKGHMKIYTISEKLANQLQILAHIAGYSAKIWIDDRSGTEHYSEVIGGIIRHNYPSYVISLSKTKRNQHPVVKVHKHRTTEHYNGKVYCVEVPNHTLFVRRNGITLWCGNCTHQLVRHRMASYLQQSDRHVKPKKGGFVTPIGFWKSWVELGNKPTDDPADYYEGYLVGDYQRWLDKCYDKYEEFIRQGVPVEDARYILPPAFWTHITMTCNARQLYHLLELRLDKSAQAEIRELACHIFNLVYPIYPIIFESLKELRDTNE